MKDQTNSLQKIQKYFQEAIDAYTENHKRESENTEPVYMEKLKKCDVENLPQRFGSSLQNGLSKEQASKNAQKYGENKFLKRKTKEFCQILQQTLLDQTLIILMIAAVVSLVVQYFFGEQKDKFWVDGVSILVAVIICSIVGSISNYQKEKQFAELDQMTEDTYVYDVIRNRQVQQVHRTDIVPGDIIKLSSGIQIPADCILYKAINVIVDESALTGESVQVLKDTYKNSKTSDFDISPIMISGSTIVSGEGIMMAVVVGRNSANGKKFQMIFSSQDQEEQTPLEQKLANLAQKIGYMGLAAGALILFILTLRLLFSDILQQGFDASRDLPNFLKYLIIAITVLVAAIPEGLPLAVTITLAFSMKKMHDQKILVRNLASCETMGSAHYICTDKTGTITQNKMKVMKFLNNPKRIEDVSEIKNVTQYNKKYLQLLKSAISINSSATLSPNEKGSQTQIALLKFVNDVLKADYKQIRNSAKDEDIFKRLPFNSRRKRMTTGVILNGKKYLFTTGASERILQACDMRLDAFSGDKALPIQTHEKQQIEKQIKQLSSKAYRVVGVGYKQINNIRSSQISTSNMRNTQNRSSMRKSQGQIQPQQKSGFVLLGFFGIQDLPRPESRQSINEALNAGIKVIMVTGDNNLTASKISQQVGIIREGFDKSMDGNQFFTKLQQKKLIYKSELSQPDQQQNDKSKNESPTLSQAKQGIWKVFDLDTPQRSQDFHQIIDRLAVLSRSKPEHKYLLVDGLIKAGNVVGVTGDGSNDAPALKRASIGLAMGQTGTQSAKNASDIVILDDRFDSIVSAIVWGRNVFVSIRKFLQFQLTINLFLIFLTLISAALIRQSIFTAVQILWFNLIMDSLAALALASEPPNRQQLLRQPPSSQQDSLLTCTMIKHILGQAIFQLGICMVILFLGFRFIPEYKDAFDDVIGTDLQAKYYNGQSEGGTIQDGRMYHISGQDNYKIYYDKYEVHSRHLTFIFNTVVFLQIFNFFCCRKVKDQQLQFFQGICSSLIFWFVIFLIVGIEIIVIQFLNEFFGLYQYGGLTIQQWLLSVAIGFTCIFWSCILRCGIFRCRKERDNFNLPWEGGHIGNEEKQYKKLDINQK